MQHNNDNNSDWLKLLIKHQQLHLLARNRCSEREHLMTGYGSSTVWSLSLSSMEIDNMQTHIRVKDHTQPSM